MAGFGAKVKLSVDRSTAAKADFNEQINSLTKQIKISNKFIVLQKDMDRVRNNAQTMLNASPIKINNIDCSKAVANLRNVLQNVINSLSIKNGVNITGLVDPAGTGTIATQIDDITDAATRGQNEINRFNAQMSVLNTTMSSLQSAYKTVLPGGKNSTAGSEQFNDITQQYTSLQQKIQEVRNSKNIASKEEIDNLQREAIAIQDKIAKINEERIAREKANNAANRTKDTTKVDAKDQVEYFAQLYKVNSLIISTKKNLDSWGAAKIGKTSGEYAKIQNSVTKLEDLRSELIECGKATKDFDNRFGNLKNKINNSTTVIKELGKNTKTFSERMGGLASKFTSWLTISQIIMKAYRALKEMVNAVIEIDAAMTELRKVTDETDATYQNFVNNASTRSKALGATLSETINATADFARLGYSIEEASDLADVSLIYKNVGDDIKDVNEASESVISTMKAFGIEASNAISIVDKFNEVGNNFAISSSGIGEALLRSASALATANNDLDESIALITAANNVVQDPQKVGTALRTVSMYLRAAKTEAEEAGESTDGMANSISELREELLSLTRRKVDIQIDEDTFKSTYQIMKELSAVWDELTDITQANILEKIGGKRNANVVSGLLSNFETAEEVLETAANSSGSALAENEKYLDSINGKINQFKSAFESASNKLINSGLIKWIIDFGTFAADGISSITDNIGSLPIVLTTAILAFNVFGKNAMQAIKYTNDQFTIFGRSTKNFSTQFKTAMDSGMGFIGSLRAGFSTSFQATNDNIGEYNRLLNSSVQTQSIFMQYMKGTDEALAGYFKSLNGGQASMKGYANYCKQAGTQTQVFSTKLKVTEIALKGVAIAGNMLLSFGISAAISLLIKGLDYLIHSSENAIKAFEEITTEWKNQNDKLIDTKKTIGEISEEYQKLSDGVDRLGNNISLTTEQYERYNSISDKISKIFPELIQYHIDADGVITAEKISVSELNKAYEALELSNRMETLKNADKAFKGFKENINPKRQFNWEGSTIGAQLKYFKLIIENIRDAEKLKDLLTGMDIDNPSSMTFIPEVIKDAGLEDISKLLIDEQVEYLQNNIDRIVNLYENAVNKANQATQKIKPIIPALLADDYIYNYKLNDDIRGIVDDIISKFDYRFYGSFNSKDEMYAWIQDNLLLPLSDPKTSADVQNAILTLLNPDIKNQSYSEYKKTIQNALNVLPKKLRDKVSIYFDVEFESEEKQNKIDDWEKKLGVDDLESELSKDQIDILLSPNFKFTGNTLEELKIALDAALGNKPIDQSITIGDTMKSVSSLTESYELIQEVKKELSETGNISAETLNSMQEKYKDLEEPISLFNAGLITSQDLLLALSDAYDTDKTNFENSINSKILATPDFYNKLGDNQKQAIEDLGKSYNVDLSNFKSVESKKLNFQAEIIKKLAANYSKYTGATLKDLKTQRANLSLATGKQREFATRYGFVDNISEEDLSAAKAELAELDKTISAIEDFDKRLNDIIKDDLYTYEFDPTKYVKPEKEKKGKEKGKDPWVEAYEKERDALDHQKNMDLISEKNYRDKLEELDKKYFAGREKYLEQHYGIQEEIYNLDKSFVTNEIDILNELDSTQEEKIKSYNKLIEIATNAIDEALKGGIVQSSDYIKSLEKDIKDAKKAIEDLDKEIFSRDMNDLEFSVEMLAKRDGTEGKQISIYREMQNKIIKEMDIYEAKGLASNKEYIQGLEKQFWDLADNINSVFETLGDKLSKKIEEKIKELEKENDRLEQDKSNWESAIGYATSVIDDRIKAIQKEKEALEEANDEKDRAIELDKLQTALENAKNQKNVRVYYEDLGFVWEANKENIEEAQKELDDFNKETLLLEKDKEIEYWESEKEKWNSIIDDYEAEQDKLIAIQQFGEDISQKILSGQSSALIESARVQYVAISNKIKNNEKEIESLNELKEQTSIFVNSQIENNNLLTANMIDNREQRKEIWDDMLSDARYYVDQYNSIMSSIDSGDYDKAMDSVTNTYLWKGKKVDSSTVNKWKSDGWVYVGSENGGTWSKNGKNSFASGTKNAPGGLSVVDENGKEAILTKLSSGRFEFLGQGDQVFTSEQTKHLWEWAKNSPNNFTNLIKKAFGFLNIGNSEGKQSVTNLYIDRVVLENVNNPNAFISELKRYAITHSNS